MDEKKTSQETELSSDARRNPQRIVFITRKTSAKVKGDVPGQVMAYPHLLLREAIAFQALVVALVLLALVWDAPLEQLANPLLTPNPAKAPWYFLGLQELLHYFPPLVAGILIPTLVVIALVVIPYFNINVEGEPMWSSDPARHLRVLLAVLAILEIVLGFFRAWTVFVPTALFGALAVYSYFVAPSAAGVSGYFRKRAVSWWVMTWFICVAVVLTIVGTFFRGPGWSWIWPWRGHAG
jgi:menaquinol-cytochrome c reductase cytochrome b/c subunit